MNIMKKAKILKRYALFALAALLVASCSTKEIVYLQGSDQLYAAPKEIGKAFELEIQPDDELAISVSSKNAELIAPFNTNTLIGSGGGATGNSYTTTANMSSGVSYFLVDKDGNIEFPVFGTINTSGMTCKQLSAEIQKRLISGGHILDAVVNTKIMSFKVTVLGEVKNAGPQTFTGQRLTVLEALGRAGDLTGSAKREEVLVIREENGKRVSYSLDLRDPNSVFESPAYYLQQNDVVYVKPNKSVRVKGSTGYTLLSIGATVVSMLVSIVSLIIALK